MKKKVLVKRMLSVVLASIMVCSTGITAYAEMETEQAIQTTGDECETENSAEEKSVMSEEDTGNLPDSDTQLSDESKSAEELQNGVEETQQEKEEPGKSEEVSGLQEDACEYNTVENEFLNEENSEENSEQTVGYQVGVQSRIQGTDYTITNVTGGGPDISTKEGTDLTTTVVSGYEFLGWYEDYTAEDIGTLVSDEKVFCYKPEKDTILTAVYKENGKEKYNLTVSGAGYKVNDSATQNSLFKKSYEAGTTITLKYVNAKRNFLYWKNSAGKIVSKEKEYTFILGGNTNITAITTIAKESGDESAFVVFLSESQQVLSARTYKATEDIVFPEPLYKRGYEFVRWNKSEQEIKDEMKSASEIIVTANYKPNENLRYSINVKYDGIEKPEDIYTLQSGDSKVLTAEEIVGEKRFQYWKKGKEIISYQTSVTIWGVEDVELTAVYVDAVPARFTTINITGKMADKTANKYRMVFIQNYALGDQDQIVKTGFVYTVDASMATDASMVLENSAMKVGISSLTTKEGAYSYTLNTKDPDKVVYIRAFIQYMDAHGYLHTKYTRIENESYSSLTV